jgi:nucleotide-binding universal stress UspA family protein
MAPHVIVSYDGTPTDRDALALGGRLHELGAPLTLVYVRHRAETDTGHELIAEIEARARLEHGAAALGDPSIERRLVVDASTARGLARLAQSAGAELIVFGSEHRTSPGRVAPGRSAQSLLDNGPASIALAPCGYADHGRDPVAIGVLPGSDDEVAMQTALSLASRYDAILTDRPALADLLVVGSRPEAAKGRVMLSATAANAVEAARAPVLVLARGAALGFETLVTV